MHLSLTYVYMDNYVADSEIQPLEFILKNDELIIAHGVQC